LCFLSLQFHLCLNKSTPTKKKKKKKKKKSSSTTNVEVAPPSQSRCAEAAGNRTDMLM